MKIEGNVLWFDKRDGNGIIKGLDGIEYYTDTSVIYNNQPLEAGQKVKFELNHNIKNCRCAWKVKLC